ncbi:hypothetical protein GCM10020219_072670 [Nonomuraea dietziae]
MWPQAVWKMPAKDSEGRELRPVALTGDGTLLVNAWRKAEQPEVLYLYDLAGGKPPEDHGPGPAEEDRSGRRELQHG